MTKHAADEEERRRLRTAVGQVKRLRQDTVRHDRSRPSPEPLQTHPDEQRVMRDLLSGRHDAAKLETCWSRGKLFLQMGQYLFYHHRLLNAGNHLHRATVFTAGLDVDIEHPL